MNTYMTTVDKNTFPAPSVVDSVGDSDDVGASLIVDDGASLVVGATDVVDGIGTVVVEVSVDVGGELDVGGGIVVGIVSVVSS